MLGYKCDRRITEEHTHKLLQLLKHFIEQEVKHDNQEATFKMSLQKFKETLA